MTASQSLNSCRTVQRFASTKAPPHPFSCFGAVALQVQTMTPCAISMLLYPDRVTARRILAKARQVSVEQKKLRAMMADAGVTDVNQLPSANGGGPGVQSTGVLKHF